MFMYLFCKAGMVLECIEAFLAVSVQSLSHNCHKEFKFRVTVSIVAENAIVQLEIIILS